MVILFQIISLLLSIFLFVSYIIYCFCKVFYDMDPEDAKYMRTERKPGTLDVHPNLNAIVLSYEITVQILGGKENVIYEEQKNLKKYIELPMLNSRTDCLALAKEVVSNCDLIHHSRIAEVEQTIYYLKKRKLSQNSITKDVDSNYALCLNSDDPNYNNLLNYIELLYEGMSEKIKGAHMIQLLARDPDNLEAMSKNETVISALGRVLREDWKRSIVLSTHLVFTFFCFSMYTNFHEVVLKCKIGSICMDIIDYELRRYDKWKADLEGVEAPSDIPIVRKPCPSSASLSEIPRSRIPEPVRPKSGNFSDANIKAVMEGSVYEDLTNSSESIDDKKLLSEAERIKRFRTLVKKQEHLLRVAFYLLLNIAEDESIEEKMTKRNIVGLLVKALERENDELLILVVTFLKKLSIMLCNKETMAGLHVLDKLPKMLESNSPDLVHLTLKLLFNLSFDSKLRYKMVKAGLMEKLISLLSDDRHQEVVYKLLYQLSQDEEVKAKFVDCVGLITDMLSLNVGSDGDKVMVALCINLSIYELNAQQMVKKNRLQSFMTRAFTYQDISLMKMLRNISDHKSTRTVFVEFVGDIAKAVVTSNDQDFVRECIGILSNLNLCELDWAEIFKHFNMVTWIRNTIMSNNADQELVLQVIVLLGTAVMDEGCAKLICESNIMSTLIDLLKTYQEDDEIVLQIVYVFYVSLSHKEIVKYIIHNTDAPAYLIDLLQDNNSTIRKLCNTCLNVIAGYDSNWADRIRIEKFRQHNSQWLQMVNTHQLEKDEDETDNEEEDLPPYLNTEYLSTAVVPTLSDLNDIQESELISEKELDFDYFNKPELIQDLEFEAL